MLGVSVYVKMCRMRRGEGLRVITGRSNELLIYEAHPTYKYDYGVEEANLVSLAVLPTDNSFQSSQALHIPISI